MKKPYQSLMFFVVIFYLLISGCGASNTAIQMAIAETEASKPTETLIPVPTNTSTATPTNTPTNTPEPTYTPTTSASLIFDDYVLLFADKFSQYTEHREKLSEYVALLTDDITMWVNDAWKLGIRTELDSLVNISQQWAEYEPIPDEFANFHYWIIFVASETEEMRKNFNSFINELDVGYFETALTNFKNIQQYFENAIIAFDG